MKKSQEKAIRVAIKNGDDTKVKVSFYGGVFTPEEFTALTMAMIETYAVGLLKTNDRKVVFDYYNNIFGIFLNKIVPEGKHYKWSKSHKSFKKSVDATLARKETAEDKKETEDNRFAAYLLCRDILIKEIGLTEESADVILNKRLNLTEKLNNPKLEKVNEKEG